MAATRGSAFSASSVRGRAPGTAVDLLVGGRAGEGAGLWDTQHQTQENHFGLFLSCLLSMRMIRKLANDPHTRLCPVESVEPWKLACQAFSWSEIFRMLQNIS